MSTKLIPTAEHIYENYNNLIMSIAHKLAKKYSMPFDELYSQAMFRVLKQLPKWNPEKGSLCTYVRNCAYYWTWKYCEKVSREIPTESDSTAFQEETKGNWISSFLEELTEETRQLVRVVIETPEELIEVIEPKRARFSRKAIEKYMIDTFNWERADVRNSFAEIRQCL